MILYRADGQSFETESFVMSDFSDIADNIVNDPHFEDIESASNISIVSFNTQNVTDDVLTVTKTATGQANVQIKNSALNNANDVIYGNVWVKFTPSDDTVVASSAYVQIGLTKYYITQEDADTWVNVGLVGYGGDGITSIKIGLESANTAPSYTVQIKHPFLVDMTALFGSGHELSEVEANEYFSAIQTQEDVAETSTTRAKTNDINNKVGALEVVNICPSGNYYSPVGFSGKTSSWNTGAWSDTVKTKSGDGETEYIGVATSNLPVSGDYAQLVNSETGDLLYFGAMVKSDVACEYVRIIGSTAVVDPDSYWTYDRYEDYSDITANTWTHVAVVCECKTITRPNIAAFYADTTTQGTATLSYKCGLIINLTKTFGAGHEPSREQMDILLSRFDNYWFTGTKALFADDFLKGMYLPKHINPFWKNSYGFDNDGLFESETHINHNWSGWSNGRYSYGQRPKYVKPYSHIDNSLVSDGMFISDGKSGAWSSQGSGENSYGGHVFQGWNEIGTYRLSLMIGNTKVGAIPREDEAAILVYSPSNCFANPNQELTEWQTENRITPAARDYYGSSNLLLGRVRIGSDMNTEGLVCERKRFTHYGDIVQSANGTTYRKLVFNSDGTVTWTDCTDEMNM